MTLQDLALQFRDVIPEPFASFLPYEDAAVEIRHFEPLLVPGHLQTRGYALAVATALGGSDPGRIADARMLRAERILCNAEPRLRYVVDEAVLRRPVGSPKAWRAQLDHLRDLVGFVGLRVVPFIAGACTERDPYEVACGPGGDVVYLEHSAGDRMLAGDEAAGYRERFEALWARLDAAESLALLGGVPCGS